MNGPAVVMLAFELTAVLFIALGLPLLRRKVRPNRLYGFRTPSTLGDERLWYEVNAHAGADLIGIGAVLAVLAPALLACAAPGTVVVACTAWLGAGAVFVTVHGFMRIRENARGR